MEDRRRDRGDLSEAEGLIAWRFHVAICHTSFVGVSTDRNSIASARTAGNALDDGACAVKMTALSQPLE